MKLFISLSLLIISVSLCAQNPVRDVIYLNNGSIIRGNIIEISNNKTIKIESCDNILVFDMTEVQKVTKEEIPTGQNIQLSSKPGGYINITSFGVLAGLKESSSISPVSIEMVNAYRFLNKYSFGIGLGIDLYDKVHIPVFLDCRGIAGWPDHASTPPEYNGALPQGIALTEQMKNFCIDRHGKGVTNCLFMDFSVRSAGLKELWKLKWHRNFDINGPWTKDHVPQPVWPEWMQGFRDY